MKNENACKYCGRQAAEGRKFCCHACEIQYAIREERKCRKRSE
jgi:hypothetical protein